MKDLTIPIPNSGNTERIEVDVKVGIKKTNYQFRVESFPWIHHDDENLHPEEKIEHLKQILRSYDNEWELIKIFTPPSDASHIQLLFRQKKKL